MGATICIAAWILASQISTKSNLDEKIVALSNDLRTTLTLFDSLKAKVQNEKEGQKLYSQFYEKLDSLTHTADSYLLTAKTDDQKAKISVTRFEILANRGLGVDKLDDLAKDLLTKYKENASLCPWIEDLTFYQYLGSEHYGAFDTQLKQAKNQEVLASANLASCFIQFLADAGDINKFRAIAAQFPKTKAGQRSAKVYDYRTKIALGQPMVDLTLTLLDGTKLSVNSLKGKVVVLNFWGFWNDGSMTELADVKEYVTKYPTRLAWIGINTDNWTSKFVAQRIKDFGISWQNAAAGSPSGKLPMDLGIVAYPAKIIIDATGVIRFVPGSRDWRTPLDEALAKAAS